MCILRSVRATVPLSGEPLFRGGLSLNTPMGPEIDGELKREMSLQMLENRTYRRFHSGKSEGHPAGATISYPGRDRCGIR